MRNVSQHWVFSLVAFNYDMAALSIKGSSKDDKAEFFKFVLWVVGKKSRATEMTDKAFTSFPLVLGTFVASRIEKIIKKVEESYDWGKRLGINLEQGVKETRSFSACLVHRGVSQVKLSSPEDRVVYWEKKMVRKVPVGIEIFPDRIVVTAEGLEAMGKKGLVILTNPKNPRVLTPKVIKSEGLFVSSL